MSTVVRGAKPCLYSDHTLSLNEIAAKLGRSSTSIEHRARKLGLHRRHKHANINHRYFHDIATTEQAYLLGCSRRMEA